MTTSKKIIIKGLVQGVGFRPSIYRIALSHNVFGTVENNNSGVIINVEGDENSVDNFITDIPKRTPIASNIISIKVTENDIIGHNNFSIKKSTSQSNEITEVSPDIATCDDCLEDIKLQDNRINYAFTNCTNCGPRFTIIKDLPYDRPKTTMNEFPMCEECTQEYSDILDRRFHAQPVACNVCGPFYTIHCSSGQISNIDEIISIFNDLILNGKIVAMKGLGGYHLACNAFDENSVMKLREVKSRDGKPFALMFKNTETVKDFMELSPTEEELLTSWRRPIVLLKQKKKLTNSISIGLDRVGVMLPYMPIHHMIFESLDTPAIVLTSGNISDEPIIISNDEALARLGDICDAVITYNRDIYNRTDDSVTKVVNDIPRLIRRSRSYAPSPIELNLNTEGIFAAGAELVNCFCIGKGNQAILSQHIGDLKNLETLEFFEESVNRYMKIFRFKPELAVMDMHPDYLSTRFAEKMNLPTEKVQHHHAHIASCMAENQLDEDIIGISFDGTGLGDDGNVWGGEFFICNLADYKRINHFEYIHQPGGDAVSKYPWRMMTSYLMHYFGSSVIQKEPELFSGINKQDLDTIVSIIENKINCPLTSSTGRLFDAISALLGVCKEATYHSEAPMQLEAIANFNINESYHYNIGDDISLKSTFADIIVDIKNDICTADIAGKFHNTIVDIIIDIAIAERDKTGISKVVLSGGSFQNSILLEKAEKRLESSGFEFFTQSSIPTNDGGIALGQLAIAAKRRELKEQFNNNN